MKRSAQARIESLASRLEAIAAEMRSLVTENLDDLRLGSRERATRARYSADPQEIERLRGLGRERAEAELAQMPHKELGVLLRKVGGSSDETKRSKRYMAQRILYHVFDFSAGHDLIRGGHGGS
jgi:hypothetical protein